MTTVAVCIVQRDIGDTANVFISHIHEDDEHLARIKKLLAARGFNIRDASINTAKPNKAKDEGYIKYDILAPRIRWAGVVVVLVSPETKTSAYVQ
jgi:ribonuclease BN (tRNA processing enzyme)